MRGGYLYQLSNLIQASPSGKLSFNTLHSRLLNNHLDQVTKKSVIKLHPNIKRTLCKSCHRLQIPGINAQIRVVNESKSQMDRYDVLQITCFCGEKKRFPFGQNPEYELFAEREGRCFDYEWKKPGSGNNSKNAKNKSSKNKTE